MAKSETITIKFPRIFHKRAAKEKTKSPNKLWIFLAVTFAALFLALLIFNIINNFGFREQTSDNSELSANEAGQRIADFLDSKTNESIELYSVSKMGNLYKVGITFNDQPLDVYVTTDGEYLIQSVVSIN